MFGHKKRDEKLDELKNQLGLSPTDAKLIAASANPGMNLFGLIGKLIPNIFLYNLPKRIRNFKFQKLHMGQDLKTTGVVLNGLRMLV